MLYLLNIIICKHYIAYLFLYYFQQETLTNTTVLLAPLITLEYMF